MGGGELIWKLLPTVARGTGYSEAHIMNNGIGEVFRLIVDPFSRLTYSTAPDDKNNIAAKRAQGKELIDALKELADSEDAADRGRRR